MIDLRSDTVTLPCKNMRRLMSNAMVGDDVYGDDPTVNELEHYSAAIHGFDASLFVTSGTQANLLAIMAHCDRGEEYICGQNAHNYRYEAGGAAVLGSVQPQPIENEADGTICLDKIRAAIKPNNFHFAKTKMLSLENTIGGKVLGLDYLKSARTLTKKFGLKLHLDGARVYNAKVALDVEITEISKQFDSMTVCLSKGLGAPVGSILLGDEEFIEKARRIRKMLGGGMRQAGILAAAGLYALKNNVERLAEDHANASYLAQRVNELPGFDSSKYQVQTNLVFLDVSKEVDIASFSKAMYEQGINITPGYQGMRLVTHSGISRDDIDVFIDKAKVYFNC
ncbi:low-specificity L-threonine aldolase [Pseudoalteromonas luteoviolacea]|uniref:low-specificity L-threonine aldolase n=1 Tax=Pseudoalteromonas luteoviolacea TaxID=43657 RepID=UPI00115141E9|nr:low-specificity L-threonine aldolase [Pseudoalteromonas luteoviolacea]TQF67545.1 low-specificity L-threonine aldolase [Pseudoalteromonas luteoviolacea]